MCKRAILLSTLRNMLMLLIPTRKPFVCVCVGKGKLYFGCHTAICSTILKAFCFKFNKSKALNRVMHAFYCIYHINFWKTRSIHLHSFAVEAPSLSLSLCRSLHVCICIFHFDSPWLLLMLLHMHSCIKTKQMVGKTVARIFQIQFIIRDAFEHVDLWNRAAWTMQSASKRAPIFVSEHIQASENVTSFHMNCFMITHTLAFTQCRMCLPNVSS